MAQIGAKHAVAALITSHTSGSAITYGAGFLVGPVVAVNLNVERSDVSDYGDDMRLENDNGVNGYTVDFETNYIQDIATKAKLLGYKGIGTTVTDYAVTDAAAPDVGFGFVRVIVRNGVKAYEGYWLHSLKFSENSLNANTKERDIAYNHTTLNGVGKGVTLDATNGVRFYDFMEFNTEAAATSWVNTKAGYSGT